MNEKMSNEKWMKKEVEVKTCLAGMELLPRQLNIPSMKNTG